MIGAAQELYSPLERGNIAPSSPYENTPQSATRPPTVHNARIEKPDGRILDLKPRLVKTPDADHVGHDDRCRDQNRTVGPSPIRPVHVARPVSDAACRRVLRCSVQRSALVQAHALISSALTKVKRLRFTVL